MIERSKVACISGHRRLPEDITELKKSLESAITGLIEQGVIYFGAGGALGFDMLAEETVLQASLWGTGSMVRRGLLRRKKYPAPTSRYPTRPYCGGVGSSFQQLTV